METTRVDGVKAPQRFKTPRSHVRAVDRGGPPERKPAVGDLIQSRSLRVRELLVLHAFFEAGGLLPEEALLC